MLYNSTYRKENHVTFIVYLTAAFSPLPLALCSFNNFFPIQTLCRSVTSLHTVAGWIEQINSFLSSETVAGCRGVSLGPEHGNAMAGMELL